MIGRPELRAQRSPGSVLYAALREPARGILPAALTRGGVGGVLERLGLAVDELPIAERRITRSA